MKIVNSKDIKRRPRKAPATLMIEALPAGMLTAREVAKRFDVNVETIRRMARATTADGKPRFKAPSKAAKTGDLVIWVYTPEDMEELADYFGERVQRVSRNKKKTR